MITVDAKPVTWTSGLLAAVDGERIAGGDLLALHGFTPSESIEAGVGYRARAVFDLPYGAMQLARRVDGDVQGWLDLTMEFRFELQDADAQGRAVGDWWRIFAWNLGATADVIRIR